ncbi:MAG: CopG family antitoxin [Rubrobacteraceae bacterium]
MTEENKLKEVNSLEEIPEFESEAEEAEFWSTHSFGDGLLDEMKPIPEGELPPPRSPGNPVSIRLDADLLNRLKALAAARGIGYQSLLEQFIAERVCDEEKREGTLK